MLFTFLIANLWMILLVSVLDFYHGIEWQTLRNESYKIKDVLEKEFIKEPGFFIFYNMHTRSNFENSVLLFYFSFTSLSTVGFGDYHPKSDLERSIGAFMLMLGVAIFSYIMSIFLDILQSFKDFTVEYGQGDRLMVFMGLMRKYNSNRFLDQEFSS